MKIIRLCLKITLFIVGFSAAAWFFMPWRGLGEYALRASGITYSSVKSANGGFTVENLRAYKLSGMADLSFRTLTVVPDAFYSILSLSLLCRLSFTDGAIGELSVTPLKKIPGIGFGDGRLTISARNGNIFLEGIRSNGALSMNGDLLIDIYAEKIIQRAALTLNIKPGVNSDPFEKEVLPLLQNIMPLEQESQGRWVLSR
ncbi:hypothetical protein FACS1894187_20010 [Synergistales bacterium]|nr:hypothetical protein FACS1894187_20010 [Synergistales bacterium]